MPLKCPVDLFALGVIWNFLEVSLKLYAGYLFSNTIIGLFSSEALLDLLRVAYQIYYNYIPTELFYFLVRDSINTFRASLYK